MLAFLIASSLAAEVPNWSRGKTLERSGTALRVVCIGNGPSLDLAREQATNACRSEAIRQVSVNISVRSESVETENYVAFHQQIKSNTKYTGVDCKPLNESIDHGKDSTTVYLKCMYDLSKIKPIEILGPDDSTVLVKSGPGLSQEVPEVDAAPIVSYRRDALHNIILSTVPSSCDTVIVNGSSVSRVIACTGNPQVLTLDSRSAKELVIRPKDKGYMPKTLSIKDLPETLEVQFEKQ